LGVRWWTVTLEVNHMTNILRTTLLLAALTGLMVWLGQILGGSQGAVLALGLAAVMNFGSYWFSDRIVIKMYGGQEIREQDDPEAARASPERRGGRGRPHGTFRACSFRTAPRAARDSARQRGAPRPGSVASRVGAPHCAAHAHPLGGPASVPAAMRAGALPCERGSPGRGGYFPPPTIILKNSSWFSTCRNLSTMNFIASTLSSPFRMVWRRM